MQAKQEELRRVDGLRSELDQKVGTLQEELHAAQARLMTVSGWSCGFGCNVGGDGDSEGVGGGVLGRWGWGE